MLRAAALFRSTTLPTREDACVLLRALPPDEFATAAKVIVVLSLPPASRRSRRHPLTGLLRRSLTLWTGLVPWLLSLAG